MYAIGDRFTTNYDDATWTLMSNTMVIDDDSFVLKPGYVVKISNHPELVAVSHELISDGVQLKKLNKI